MKDLSGKVILITGASSGIGLATAQLAAARGAKAIINFHSNESAAKEAVQLIRKNGGDAISIQADVTEKEEIDSMVEQAFASFGTIDVLINNAGGGICQSSFIDMSEELWDESFRLNVNSVLLCFD